ncbi:MAG: hypothetical protein MUF04_06020 [Akkermansiaceae bacterium]|jgi:hypothetical protein|nr:hypothetical protein [Akkermansiaceae bacterium]
MKIPAILGACAIILGQALVSRAAPAEPVPVVSSSANDQLLYFTSDRSGKRAIYRMAVPEAEPAPNP